MTAIDREMLRQNRVAVSVECVRGFRDQDVAQLYGIVFVPDGVPAAKELDVPHLSVGCVGAKVQPDGCVPNAEVLEHRIGCGDGNRLPVVGWMAGASADW